MERNEMPATEESSSPLQRHALSAAVVSHKQPASTDDDDKVYTSNGNKLAFTIENLIKKRVESGEVSILRAKMNDGEIPNL